MKPVNDLNIQVPYASSASSYVTSLSLNREEREVSVSDSSVVVNIISKSITTIVVEE